MTKRYYNPHDHFKYVSDEEKIANVNRPIFEDFESYANVHPEGRRYWHWTTNSGLRPVILLPADDETHCLPGRYYWAYIARYPDNPLHKKRGRWYIHVADCDDGEITHTYETEAEAREAFDNLRQLAPFYLYDLKEFGYNEWTN